MPDYEELQCRAEELAQLARECLDVRVRNILTEVSREFRFEAEQVLAINGA